MTTRASSFKQADVTRALRSALALGLKPSGFRIDPTSGAIEVMLGEEAARFSNSFDSIMGAR